MSGKGFPVLKLANPETMSALRRAVASVDVDVDVILRVSLAAYSPCTSAILSRLQKRWRRRRGGAGSTALSDRQRARPQHKGKAGYVVLAPARVYKCIYIIQ